MSFFLRRVCLLWSLSLDLRDMGWMMARWLDGWFKMGESLGRMAYICGLRILSIKWLEGKWITIMWTRNGFCT